MPYNVVSNKQNAISVTRKTTLLPFVTRKPSDSQNQTRNPLTLLQSKKQMPQQNTPCINVILLTVSRSQSRW